MAQDQSTADKLIIALGQLGYLDENLAAFRLQQAFIDTYSMASLKWAFVRPEDSASWSPVRWNLAEKALSGWFKQVPLETSTFDGMDRGQEIDMLGNSPMAYVISKIDDPWGFKDLCNSYTHMEMFS